MAIIILIPIAWKFINIHPPFWTSPYPLLIIKCDSYKITDNINRFYEYLRPTSKSRTPEEFQEFNLSSPTNASATRGVSLSAWWSWLPLLLLPPSDVIIMIPGDRHKIHLNAAGSPLLPPCVPLTRNTLRWDLTALKLSAQSAVSDIKLTLTRSAVDDDDHWPGTTTTSLTGMDRGLGWLGQILER